MTGLGRVVEYFGNFGAAGTHAAVTGDARKDHPSKCAWLRGLSVRFVVTGFFLCVLLNGAFSNIMILFDTAFPALTWQGDRHRPATRVAPNPFCKGKKKKKKKKK